MSDYPFDRFTYFTEVLTADGPRSVYTCRFCRTLVPSGFENMNGHLESVHASELIR